VPGRSRFVIDGFEIRMTGSVGAVFCPEDGRGYEELLKRADDALYRAKATSRKASIKASSHQTQTTN
jgi:GGDEF domain-containing protein